MLMAREHGLGGLYMVRDPAAPATPFQARLLVVILNYNGIVDTLACLASLRAQTVAHSTMVIDNASRDDDLSPIASRFPEVEVVRIGTWDGPAATMSACGSAWNAPSTTSAC
jgi:hypothetical protein